MPHRRAKLQVLVALVIALSATPALAHGEGYLVLAAGGLGVAAGAVFGAIAGLRRVSSRPTLGQSILLFLALGCLAMLLTSNPSEGVALFLVFGGIGGLLPLALGYFATRATCRAILAGIARRTTRPNADA